MHGPSFGAAFRASRGLAVPHATRRVRAVGRPARAALRARTRPYPVAMDTRRRVVARYAARTLALIGFLAGVAVLAHTAALSDPPTWLWWSGAALVLSCGMLTGVWVSLYFRYPDPVKRRAYVEEFRARQTAASSAAEQKKADWWAATTRAKAVLRSGVDGRAVVTQVRDGDVASELQQLVHLELEVTVGDGPAYRVSTGEFLSATSAGSVRVGARLPVKVDPEDPRRVAVDWDRALTTPTVS